MTELVTRAEAETITAALLAWTPTRERLERSGSLALLVNPAWIDLDALKAAAEVATGERQADLLAYIAHLTRQAKAAIAAAEPALDKDETSPFPIKLQRIITPHILTLWVEHGRLTRFQISEALHLRK